MPSLVYLEILNLRILRYTNLDRFFFLYTDSTSFDMVRSFRPVPFSTRDNKNLLPDFGVVISRQLVYPCK